MKTYYKTIKQISEEDSKESQAMIFACYKNKKELIEKYKLIKPKPQQ